jgi:hypothetical protein
MMALGLLVGQRILQYSYHRPRIKPHVQPAQVINRNRTRARVPAPSARAVSNRRLSSG